MVARETWIDTAHHRKRFGNDRDTRPVRSDPRERQKIQGLKRSYKGCPLGGYLPELEELPTCPLLLCSFVRYSIPQKLFCHDIYFIIYIVITHCRKKLLNVIIRNII